MAMTQHADAATQRRPDARSPRRVPRGLPSIRGIISKYGLIAVWIVMIVVFTVTAPGRFMTAQNVGNVFGSQAVLGIIALALMIPVIAGEWDLSIGANVGLSLTVVGALNVTHELPIWIAALVAVAAATLVGAINGFFIVVAGVQSLIATLGMGTLLAGLVYAISTTTISGLDPTFVEFGQRKILSIQAPFYVCIALAVVLWYVLRWTPTGRYLYFVGSNRNVAQLSGIRVGQIRFASLLLSGFGAGIAGVVLASSLGASGPSIGQDYLLPAFAAVFLGSTVLVPGRINVWGTVIAVYFLMTGVSGMQLLGAESWVQDIFYGAILVVAVALSLLAKRPPKLSFKTAAIAAPNQEPGSTAASENKENP